MHGIGWRKSERENCRNSLNMFLWAISVILSSVQTVQNGIVHFRIGQIMHNNQIGCLAWRVYIYLQAPRFRGVPEGHPVIVDYFYHEEVRNTNNTGVRNRK